MFGMTVVNNGLFSNSHFIIISFKAFFLPSFGCNIISGKAGDKQEIHIPYPGNDSSHVSFLTKLLTPVISLIALPAPSCSDVPALDEGQAS